MILIGISQIISEAGLLFIWLLAICAAASVELSKCCFLLLYNPAVSTDCASCPSWEETVCECREGHLLLCYIPFNKQSLSAY